MRARVAVLVVAASAALGSSWAVPAAGAQGGGTADVTVLDDPQATAPASQPVTLTVRSGATDAEDLVFLRSEGKDRDGVKLVVRGTALAFTTGVAQGGTVDLPADQATAVGLKAEDPPRGTSSATVYATIPKEGTVKLLKVKIVRLRADVIHVAGTDANGKLSLDADATAFSRELRITSSSPDEERVTVAVEQLTGPDGATLPLEAELDGTPLEGDRQITVPPFGRVPLTLSATVDAAGDYTTTITTVHDATPQDVPVTITRTRAAPTITIGTFTAPQSTVRFRKANATVSLPVDETSGRSLSLAPPAVDLNRQDGEAQRSYPDFSVTFREQKGDAIPIPAGGSTTVHARFSGLGPGTYTAHIRFHGGETPVQATATIYVRRAAWVAGLVILLGIALAEGIRYLAGPATTRLLRKQVVARLLARLERVSRTGGAAEGDAEVEALKARIEELAAKVRDDDLDPTTEAAEITGRLDVLARLLQLRAALDTANPKPEGVQGQLDVAAGFLRDQGGTIDTATAALDEATRLLFSHAELARAVGTAGDSAPPAVVKIVPLATLRDQLSLIHWGLALLAAAVAIALGLSLLWAPAPGWGSPQDILAAFLWGLGLQAASGTTFSGLAAITAQIVKPE